MIGPYGVFIWWTGDTGAPPAAGAASDEHYKLGTLDGATTRVHHTQVGPLGGNYTYGKPAIGQPTSLWARYRDYWRGARTRDDQSGRPHVAGRLAVGDVSSASG